MQPAADAKFDRIVVGLAVRVGDRLTEAGQAVLRINHVSDGVDSEGGQKAAILQGLKIRPTRAGRRTSLRPLLRLANLAARCRTTVVAAGCVSWESPPRMKSNESTRAVAGMGCLAHTYRRTTDRTSI